MRDARRRMGRIIAESIEDEDEMETRSSTITLDMLEKAEDQFWEESMDASGSYDDDDATDDALGEGTVMVVRRTKQTNARRRNAQIGNGRKSVQGGSTTARDVVLRSSERAMEISKRAAERAEFVRRQLEAVPNKKEIISATAAVTAATAAISTAISEPLMTMAGSVVAFSLVKSFETMDKQLRQKQREIEKKKREENVDLLMKSKERKVETKVEVVDTPLEVVSATTTVEDVAKKEEGKIVEKEEEILAPASATTATTTAKSISATRAFVSKIANENESAVVEARKRREKILNEMAQYDDARLNSIVRTTGEMAETTTTTNNNNNNNNNTNFANRASKRTSDTLGYNATPPQNIPEEAVNATTSTEKRDDERDEKMQKISLFEAFFAVFTFPFTLLYELFRECVDVLKRFFVNQNNAKVA